jgi:ribulose-phosphate 3-epimerase
MAVRINPSILAADFVNLQRDVEAISSADLVHVDVMDNHFVPNLTFGPQMVGRIQDVSAIPLDVHLMIDDPERWAPQYADLGAFSVTFHAESTPDPVAVARELRALGARAGLALKPATPVEDYLDILAEFDQLLVMTVEPGFGGQSFMPDMMNKVATVRRERELRALDFWLQVDGGVTLDTIVLAAEAGADTFVAGSSVFRSDRPEEAIRALRETARHTHDRAHAAGGDKSR